MQKANISVRVCGLQAISSDTNTKSLCKLLLHKPKQTNISVSLKTLPYIFSVATKTFAWHRQKSKQEVKTCDMSMCSASIF